MTKLVIWAIPERNLLFLGSCSLREAFARKFGYFFPFSKKYFHQDKVIPIGPGD